MVQYQGRSRHLSEWIPSPWQQEAQRRGFAMCQASYKRAKVNFLGIDSVPGLLSTMAGLPQK